MNPQISEKGGQLLGTRVRNEATRGFDETWRIITPMERMVISAEYEELRKNDWKKITINQWGNC